MSPGLHQHFRLFSLENESWVNMTEAGICLQTHYLFLFCVSDSFFFSQPPTPEGSSCNRCTTVGAVCWRTRKPPKQQTCVLFRLWSSQSEVPQSFTVPPPGAWRPLGGPAPVAQRWPCVSIRVHICLLPPRFCFFISFFLSYAATVLWLLRSRRKLTAGRRNIVHTCTPSA